jgi:hypothetical protein
VDARHPSPGAIVWGETHRFSEMNRSIRVGRGSICYRPATRAAR